MPDNEVNLIQLAEKYLTSSKMQHENQLAYERQLITIHRDAEASRISTSVIGEDHVLVGGRITSGSGETSHIPPITAKTTKSSALGDMNDRGVDTMFGTRTDFMPKQDVHSVRQTETPYDNTNNLKTVMPQMRKIVV